MPIKSLSSVQVPFLQMALCGFAAFVISVGVLMPLGTRWHNNYEYFGDYPVLYLGPAFVAFVAPAIVAWRRARSKKTKPDA